MILQTLDHPNVIKLRGLATSRMQYSLYLVFDYMQFDLTRIISRPGERLTEPQVGDFFPLNFLLRLLLNSDMFVVWEDYNVSCVDHREDLQLKLTNT